MKPCGHHSKGDAMTEKEMQNALHTYYSAAQLVVPHLSLDYEIDFAVLSKSNYMYDIEIKRSRHDWVADFRKEKWAKHSDIGLQMTQAEHWKRIRRFYFAVLKGMEKDIPPCVPEWTGILVVSEVEHYGYGKVNEFRKAQPRPCSKLDIDDIAYIGRILHFRYWHARKWPQSLQENETPFERPEFCSKGHELKVIEEDMEAVPCN